MPYIDKMIPLKPEPGIQMDGTEFAKNNWTIGFWTRFNNRGYPQKMGGFKVITDQLPSIARGIMVIPLYPKFRAFMGFRDKLLYQDFDTDGVAIGGLIDITPLGLVDDPQREWDFDILYNKAGGGSLQLIAHAPPNLQSIASDVETEIYFADIVSGATPVSTGYVASGGVTVSGPFLFYFGNNGRVAWSEANDPTAEAGDEFVTGNKVLYALPVRAGAAAPGALFWSLDCLVKATYSPNEDTGDPNFTFDSITCESSVLSSRGIIEYDSIYYWAATDRFLFYNGIVRELPNDMCLDYFFKNINMSQRQKVFVTKVTRWGEIWWFYPKGDDSVECNAAVIYNIRLNKWYSPDSHGILQRPPDAPYEYVGRSCGEYEQTFSYPVWVANTPKTGSATYDLYMQEFGVDVQDAAGDLETIPAGIVSNIISIPITDNVDKEILIYRVELDLVQSNLMQIKFEKSGYPRSTPIFTNYDFTVNQKKIDMREQARNIRIWFVSPGSDGTGGDFQLGRIMLAVRVADQRPLGTTTS